MAKNPIWKEIKVPRVYPVCFVCKKEIKPNDDCWEMKKAQYWGLMTFLEEKSPVFTDKNKPREYAHSNCVLLKKR